MRRSRLRGLLAAAAIGLAVAPLARAATLPFPVGNGQGVFLHISDIHFDPFEDRSLFAQLVDNPADTWQGILAKASDGRFESSDSNFALFRSALENAKGPAYDFVLNTGDALVHDFLTTFDELERASGRHDDRQAFVVKTLQFVDLMLKNAFPGVPIITTLGNNDSDCDDYAITPDGPMLKGYGENLPVVAGDKQALKDFERGGYYLVPHPTVAKHDFIVLNSIFWSRSYRDSCGTRGADPGAAELAWLKTMLDQERAANRTASLIMHIPPGIDADKSRTLVCPNPGELLWTASFAGQFLDLTAAYPDVLRDAYAGHTHMDEFRVVSDAKGKPYMTVQITPAISPRFGNDPAFTVALYDRGDATVKDTATFYLSNLTSAGPKTPGDWKLEYVFADTYGAQNYTPADMQALAKSIRAGGAKRASYMTYFAAMGSTQHMTAANFMAYSCAQTAMTLADYTACRCPNTTVRPKPAN